MDVWFARCGADLSPASLAVLRQLLIDVIGHLGAGFDSPGRHSPTLLKDRL
jgi:hypothetical protein